MLKYPYGNHIGEQFGHLLAVSAIESDAETGDPVIYDCKCMKCGKEHIHVLDRDLLSYKVRCCENCNPHDLTGMKFGRLEVLQRVSNGIHRESRYLCRCICGKHEDMIVRSNSLLTRHKQSCGCLLSEKTRERAIAMSKDPKYTMNMIAYVKSKEYKESLSRRMRSINGRLILDKLHTLNKKWTDDERYILGRLKGMKTRCNNVRFPFYSRYGGRGIYICDEWMDPKHGKRSFIDWSKSNGFNRGLEIDRIDNNGPYAPWNCRWVSKSENNNNKSTNRVITVNGVSHTAIEWSRISGVSYDRIIRRDDEHVIELIKEAMKN